MAENLEVKDVVVDGRRYVVCRNPQEEEKDRAAREAILAKLEQALAHGPKSVIGNRGFARFVKIRRGSVSINQNAVEADARLDGKFVLTTNVPLPTDQIALAYKSLWRVERTFREEKSTLEVRPIFHQQDRNCIGHIVGCFLALRLEVDLQRRLDDREVTVSWPDLMRDPARVQSVIVDLDGQRYRLRTDMTGRALDAFVAGGRAPTAPGSPSGRRARRPGGVGNVVPNDFRKGLSGRPSRDFSRQSVEDESKLGRAQPPFDLQQDGTLERASAPWLLWPPFRRKQLASSGRH